LPATGDRRPATGDRRAGRAGINALDRGQREAAYAVGMTAAQTDEIERDLASVVTPH